GPRQRRLARAVGADHRHEAPRVDRQVRAPQDGRVADPHLGPGDLEQTHYTALRSSHRNSGTPIATIIGPTGSSSGALIVRATTSPAVSSAAPVRAET